MRFDRADFEGQPGAVAACAACGRPPEIEYFTIAGNVLCRNCRNVMIAPPTDLTELDLFLRASVFGVGAAVLGAAGFWVAGMINGGRPFWFVALFVGMFVGSAVSRGSGRRGGLVFQILAVLLTYESVVAGLVPLLLAQPDPSGATGITRLIGTTIGAHLFPILGFFGSGLLGVLIVVLVFFSLRQPWMMNRSIAGFITGPFPVVQPVTSG